MNYKLIYIFLANVFITTMFPMAPSIMRLPSARPIYNVNLNNQSVKNFWFFTKKTAIPKTTEVSVVVISNVKQIDTPIPVNKNIHVPVRKLRDLRGFNALVGKIPEQVKECAEILKSFKEYEEMGAHVPKGLLMVGPPGTGKTSIAKAMAQEAGVYFSCVTATEFNNKWYGVSEQNVRNVFEECRDKAKERNQSALLFIDEIDSIGSRTALNSAYGADRRVLSELLNQMDGCTTNKDGLFATDIFVMGATNSADSLDPALKRPGRFDKIIEIPLPDIESIKALLTHYLSFTRYDMESISPEFIEETAINIVGTSPADIKYIINECAILAVRSKSPAINRLHIHEVVFNRLAERNKNVTQSLK